MRIKEIPRNLYKKFTFLFVKFEIYGINLHNVGLSVKIKKCTEKNIKNKGLF